MAKGLLVIDIPCTCIECPMCYKDEVISLGNFKYEQMYKCKKQPKEIENGYLNSYLLIKKPEWCPIKRPEKSRDVTTDFYGWGWVDGYNTCIEEILGERNE